MRYLSLITVLTLLLVCSFLRADEDQAFTEIHGNGVYQIAEKEKGEKAAEKIANEIATRDLLPLARRTNNALSAIIKIGYLNLKKRGYYKDAVWLEQEWKKFNGSLERIVANPNRDIGSFKPLSEYLAVAYEILEYNLGYKLCYTLRLTDIKSLNYAIPVVFKPCEYGLKEFELHFIHDAKYRGLAPVVSYWTTVITCSVASFGAGYFFICSPLGMLVELGMDKAVAPWLAPKIYNMVCE